MKWKGVSLIPPVKMAYRRKGQVEINPFMLEAFKPHPAVTWRQALLWGQSHKDVTFDYQVQCHELLIDGSRVTSDIPSEITSQYLEFKDVRGKVLVAGLGIGLCVHLMARMKKVESIVVVEKNRDVIDLVIDYLPKGVRVVHDDIFNYLGKGRGEFDSVYLDIWTGTGEATWVEDVVPLRRLIYRKYGRKRVRAWGETEMKTQVAEGCYRSYQNNLREHVWLPNSVFLDAYWRRFNKLWSLSLRDQMAKYYLRMMVNRVGDRTWNSTFRWDEVREEMKEKRKQGKIKLPEVTMYEGKKLPI